MRAGSYGLGKPIALPTLTDGQLSDGCTDHLNTRCIFGGSSCLGTVVENVVATMLAEHCEWKGIFHPGQYGCRRNRSAVDAVGVLMVKTQDAWSRRQVV
jgi:hypothetical protein